MRIRVPVAWIALALAISVPVSGQADVRSRLKVQPSALYPDMLRFAARGHWDRLDAALQILEPLLAETDSADSSRPGRSLRLAIQSRSVPGSLIALQRFVAAGAIVVIGATMERSDPAARRALVRVAFTEYLTLAPTLKESAFDLHQRIEYTFRSWYASVNAGGEPFKRKGDDLRDLLSRVGQPAADRP